MNNKTRSDRFGIRSKITGIIMSAALLTSAFTGLGAPLLSAVGAETSLTVSAASDYGLLDNIQDGNILHCFCWKYDDITAMLPEIAEAGFTSIQTSPAQATAGTGAWWWFYQPLGFYIGSNAMGNKDSLRRLCSEADKYGIKVIADVVANHLAGDHGSIQDDLKDGRYWHWDDYNADDGDRYRVTHGKIGMPDLKTEESHVQQCVARYIQELKGVGIDGIRFDAAKHIGLPSEGDNFWPTVTADKSLWYYGEILNNPGLSFDNEQRGQAISVMKEYSNYMSVTDSPYGMMLRNSFAGSTAPNAFGNYCGEWMGLSNSRLVYWAESHDTWSNNKDYGYSNEISQNNIDRAYAIAASRNGITALYLSRPYSSVKDDIHIGQKGSTHFTSKEVAAVNHFKNIMNGQKDYFASGNNCSVVCREKGAVVVLGSGGNRDVTVPNGGGTTKPGTYTDEITGSRWTVTATTMSGHVGDTGIAVFYDPANKPAPAGSVSASPASTSFTNSISVTLNANNVSNASYTTSEGASGGFTSGKTITLGASASVGSTITLTLSGTKQDGSSVNATYKYVKKDPSAVTSIYFDNNSYNWGSVYAYIYNKSGGTVTPSPSPQSTNNILFTNSLNWGRVNAYFFNSNGTVGSEWPGTQMSSVGDNGYGSTNFSAGIPGGATHVVFNDGGTTQTYDLPLAGVAGYWLDGSPSNAKSWTASSTTTTTTTTTTSSDPVPCNAAWPGQKMTKDSSTGYYTLTVPDSFTEGYVIFSDGNENTTKRYPADMKEGLSIGGSSRLFSANNKWSLYTGSTPVPTPVPKKISVALSASPSTVTEGQTITLKATPSNANGSVTYEFRTGSSTITSSGNRAMYTPTSAGTFTFTVTAKDSSGSASASASVSVQKTNLPPEPVPTPYEDPELINSSSVSASSIRLGGSVTLRAYASGGKSPYQYAFLTKKSSASSYSTLRSYGSSTSAVFTPTSAGTYSLLIKVKDNSGTVKEKKFSLTVTETAKALSNTSKISASTIKLGSTIKVSCAASGGKAPYKYAVYYKKSGSSKFTSVQSFSSNSSVTIKPAAATAYVVRVKVRDSASSVVTKDYKFSVTGSTAALKNTAKLSAATVTLGKSVTLYNSATGGSAPYVYSAYYKKSGSETYHKLCVNSTAAKVTVKPGAATTYDILVRAKDKKGKVAEKKLTLKVTNNTAAPLANTSKLVVSSIKLGNNITVNCSATGGKGTYQFAAAIKKSSSTEYKTIKGYSTSKRITYKPATAAKYDLRVKVKDAKGTVRSKVLSFRVIK